MKIGVLKETKPGEKRVVLSPEGVRKLRAKGPEVAVQAGAGESAGFADADYRAAGATLEPTATELLAASDLVLKINAPTPDEIAGAKQGAGFLSLLFPLNNLDLVRAMNARALTAISLDRVPRTTLAQSMDVLSSQATCAGYRAVIIAAEKLPTMCPLFMTAAGRSDPARFVILGAGVAGLVAIGIARRLGAIVEAYDVRAVVKEQVESLGATFIDVGEATDAQSAGGYAKEISADQQARINAKIADHLAQADVCITTALIPGRAAPRLVSADMARRMRPGSVILDMAAEQGGNCELTKPGETVVVDGVVVVGPTNLASDVARDASAMFSRNVEKLVTYMLGKDGAVNYDFGKEIIKGCVVTHGGKVVDEQVAALLA
jgi:NAD(P) transhydrogenase subunit alpha